MPSEPAESGYCQKIKLKSYPLYEQGGVVWVYMGPPEHQPPYPEFEFSTVPMEQTYTSKRVQECNWLQAMEGGIDSSHVSFLHSGALNTDPLFKGSKGNQYNLGDKKPVFEVVKGRCPRLGVVWADGIDEKPWLIEWVKGECGWDLRIVKRSDKAKKGFEPLPKRWVVERTFGWLGRYRRLSKDYEVLPETSEAMIRMAMIHVMVRRLEPTRQYCLERLTVA